jgi:hypothetical protein
VIAFRPGIGFGLGMKLIAPYTYVDDDGNRYYNVRQATKLIKGVSEGTLWLWAAKGVTSFGVELNVKREPMLHRPDGRRNVKSRREERMLIPENAVQAIQEVFQAVGKDRPGQWTHEELDRAKSVARRIKLKGLGHV